MKHYDDQEDEDTFGIEVLRITTIIVVCVILAFAGGLIGGLLWGWLA